MQRRLTDLESAKRENEFEIEQLRAENTRLKGERARLFDDEAQERSLGEERERVWGEERVGRYGGQADSR